ncbi:MAG: DEAD/DEAH box helicase [Chloroflexi bacterium]|nr:DEAD/DEAH box helicase [Chloroflexota bacterium]
MPLTLHAAWLRSEQSFPDGYLFFWAENADFAAPDTSSETVTGQRSTTQNTTRINGNRQRLPKIPSHPDQVAVGQLRSLLNEEFPALTATEMRPANAEIWLPSRNNVPLPRRAFSQSAGSAPGRTTAYGRSTARGTPPDRKAASSFSTNPNAPVLSAWQITGLTVPPLAALRILSHLNYKPVTTPGATATLQRVRLGNDLIFWSNAAKYTLELLIGQHYLPGLQPQPGDRLAAAWQPALYDERVEQRLDQLVQSMPPVCRTYNVASPADAPAPAEILEHFITTLIDTAIRSWQQDTHRTRQLEASLVEQTPVIYWLDKLLTNQHLVHLPPQPAYQLYQAWRTWTEQLYLTRDANFRICFQLEPPYTMSPGVAQDAVMDVQSGTAPEVTEDVNWTLHYSLQARDNPGLVVSAHEVWEAPNNSIRFGTRLLDKPQERLLAGLSMASRLFAPIARSLRSPRPEAAQLSTAEAYEFLRESGPLLESSGFGLILPEWWRANRHVRLGLRLRLTSDEVEDFEPFDFADTPPNDTAPIERGPQRGLDAPVSYAWELTLGGERLSRGEFEQLAARRSPLVRLRDRWIELDPAQVEAARRFLGAQRASGTMSLLQAVRMAQTHGDNAADMLTETLPTRYAADNQTAGLRALLPADLPDLLPLDAVDVEGRLAQTLDQLRSQQPYVEIEEPVGFIGELRPYQRRGVGWLAYLRRLGLGACLADDMGLGKTVQSIALLLYTRQQQDVNSHMPALLICPTSVVANWQREVERFAPALRVLVHHGSSRLSGTAFIEALRHYDLVITSYGTARRDVDFLTTFEWSDLILDEAQNIKNPGAKQTQAVRRILARNHIALTGTPVENRLSELWSILEFLNPGYLETYERFHQRYVIPIERYNDDESAEELRRLVQPFLLRRLKSDPAIIADLPEKNEMVVYCSLTPEQANLYEKVVQESLLTIDQSDGIQRRGLVLGLLTRLKQICNHPAHYLKQTEPLQGRSGKLNRMTEMLEEALAVGDQALIFTQFVEMGELLKKHLQNIFGAEVLFLHGGTSLPQRDRMVQTFQDEDGPGIFILSLRAGGAGLNLTRANHVFHFDRWWNPAVENQATDRAFRIGQRRNVQVHKFVVAGTLEERIHAMIESKQSLAESIIGSGEQWLTELNTDQLRDLLLLRRDMLEEE